MSKKKVDTEEIPITVEAPSQEEPAMEPQEDWQDRFLRCCAEFDNYKKRTARERDQLWLDTTAATVEAILPALDSLDRAAAADEEGYEAVRRQFSQTLEQLGVKKIDALGKPFDPELHNAVMHVEDDSLGKNEVVEEFATGYILKDKKVIRHSMVKVAN